MRRIVLLLTVMAALMLPACIGVNAPNPRVSFVVALQAYEDTLKTTQDLHTAGLISDEDVLNVEKVRVHVWIALEAWKEALLEGGSTEAYIRAFQQGLQRIAIILAEAQGD